MGRGTKMVRGYNWPIIAFFGVTMSVAVIGGPWYAHRFGVSGAEWLLTLFFMAATGMSITMGYHRLYAHSTFKTNRFVQFLVLFFGAAAFEQSALTWSSGHRDHHRYVDTELDPYSIKKGFWYAHIGWMTLWKQNPDYSNAKDLMKNRMLMHQHDHYALWGFVAGIFFPVLLGAAMGHALGAFIFAVCVRLTFVYHATFSINSVCHSFGKATYDIHATARDHWFVALLTNGEGYHNFHHRFPTDYRNGRRWYHWDPSKWAIAALARLKMAWDVQRVSDFSVLEAKFAAENETACEQLMKIKENPQFIGIKEKIHTQYTLLIQKLSAWKSIELRSVTPEHASQARSDFKLARRQWKEIAALPSRLLEAA